MASSSFSSMQQSRQVFLSFRGKDTRLNFTSHLHAALEQKGIDTFIDYQLIRGEEISPALLTAIDESKISVIVLSKNYAFSSWCLDELSKILECKKTKGQIVVPIFFYVDPSDVEKQTGSFAEAFAKHEQRFKDRTDKVERWRAALKEVARLAGYHLHAQIDRHESTLIKEIVNDILKKLVYKSLYDDKHLVGIHSHVEQIESLLCIGSENVRFIGIWGMGGIGKTTIAAAVYNRLFAEFKGYAYFLKNVREKLKNGQVHSLEELFSKVLGDENLYVGINSQPAFVKDMLCRRKVFIVLDDIDDSMLLDLLPEKHCFKPGSRIIITSRDKQVLQQLVDVVHEVQRLKDDEALKLFNLSAFKQSHPKQDFMELSMKVVHYAKGVPLALRVLGSSLCGRSKSYWEGDLNKLKKIANPKIDNVLRISYDGLDGEVKDIFLDIACFFKGKDRDYVTNMLDSCYISIRSGISVLIDKALVTLLCNKLEMHDLLQEMGWNIIRQSNKEPGKRSRLWIPEDIYHVLKNNTGTEIIEGMFLDMSKIREVHLSATVFARMYNLKLLNLYYSDLEKKRKVYISQQDLESLPAKLSYLHWDDYPSKSLPSNFCPENLVELSMPNSHVKRLWNGVQNLVKLKKLNLCQSQHLMKIPDLSRATNLERMELDSCTSLVEVTSIRHLNKLSFLSLTCCQNLGNFPNNLHLRSLTTLILSGCSNITEFPEISKNLEELYLNETAIKEVPSSILCLSRLKYLYLEYCIRLERLPSSICKLKFLEKLSLRGCLKLESFPEILETMECLEYLYLSDTSIEELPSSIKHLVRLVYLELDYCQKLKSLPSSIRKFKFLAYLSLSNITKFQEITRNLVSFSNLLEIPSHLPCIYSLRELDLSGNNFKTIPASFKQLLELEKFDISYCERLQSLPELPPNLQYLNAHSCTSLEAVSSSFTSCLRRWIKALFTNCLKLDHNAINHILAEPQVLATEALKLHHKVNHGFSSLVCLPGSKIPEWFSCQSTGSSVTTQLPLTLTLCGDDHKLVGFAMCAVVALEDYDEGLNFRIGCRYNVRNEFYDYNKGFTFLWSEKFVHSDHVVLFYDYNSYLYLEGRLTTFEFYAFPQDGCKVIKCGIHPLYPQNEDFVVPHQLSESGSGSGNSDLTCAIDAEECNADKIHRGSSPYDPTRLSLKCGGIGQDFGEPMVQDGTIIKRCRGDYCYDKAEPIGSFSPGSDTIMIQPTSPYDRGWLSLNYDVIDQDFGEPMQEYGTSSKRSCDDLHNNEAEPSGNFSYEEVEEEPHHKRLKCIKFF